MNAQSFNVIFMLSNTDSMTSYIYLLLPAFWIILLLINIEENRKAYGQLSFLNLFALKKKENLDKTIFNEAKTMQILKYNKYVLFFNVVTIELILTSLLLLK